MLYIPFPLKRCSKCGEFKPATTVDFHKHKETRDRLNSWCRDCCREKNRRWAQENPEKNRRWAQENPEKRREVERRWTQENPEKVNEKNRRWARKNPEQRRETFRRWQKDNPEKLREYDQQRRTRKRSLPATFTVLHWSVAVEYFHGACAYCEHGPSMFDRSFVLHQDHFIPLTRGGGYTPDNIVPACQWCNTSKNDSDPVKWITKTFGKRKAKIIIDRIAEYFQSVAK